MLTLEQTKTFKKCLKKYRHKKSVLEELKKMVELLVTNKPLPIKYNDHELKGNHKGIRELHLKPMNYYFTLKCMKKKLYSWH